MENTKFLKKLAGKRVIGIDEVGRGCWAGPLVVGAVILDAGIPGITDSKLLTRAKRTYFDAVIREESSWYGIGWVWPAEIDELGLTKATTLAIERAIADAPAHDFIVIDGSINYLPEVKNTFASVKADNFIPSVSAASIIAKVARDNYMSNLPSEYSGYGFELHVGYGTARHQRALSQHGVTPLHRLSFKPVSAIAGNQTS